MMKQFGNGKYSMDVDAKNKTFTAFGEGVFTPEQGGEFFNAFVETAKKVSVLGDYILIVDVKGVKSQSQDSEKVLTEVMRTYASDDFKFKKRYMTKLSSVIAQSQVQRIGNSIQGFNQKITFIKDKNEVLK